MKFNEAYSAMMAGKKITRPALKNSYWYMDPVKGKLTIHLASGKNISYGQLDLTVKNCLAEDWEIYTEEESK